MTQAANITLPHVQAFCESIVAGGQLVTVPIEPPAHAQALDCFFTVPEHVQQHGGRCVIGWAIWEWEPHLIEAEFHAVWERPSDGALIDLTPRPGPINVTSFLPDPSRTYEGRQVDNIRKPLSKNPAVLQLIYLYERIFQILNAGERANQHKVNLPTRERKQYESLLKQLAQVQKKLAPKQLQFLKPTY